MKKLILFFILFLFITTFYASADRSRLKLGTTTSIDNTGLLKVLLPPFEKMFNVRVDVIAVGTGKAIELGENGDLDVLIVHDKESEEQFMKEGYGVNRREVMYNDFIIIGPDSDPAGIKGMKDSIGAMKKIFGAKSLFISRGDKSGTHLRERKLWKSADIEPKGGWYIETGQGMGTTLQIADEKYAYTLSDRSTYLAYKNKIRLTILVEGDIKNLKNVYSIIPINPSKYAHANYVYAMALVGWVTSIEGQKIIGEFKSPSGEVMFYPTAVTNF